MCVLTAKEDCPAVVCPFGLSLGYFTISQPHRCLCTGRWARASYRAPCGARRAPSIDLPLHRPPEFHNISPAVYSPPRRKDDSPRPPTADPYAPKLLGQAPGGPQVCLATGREGVRKIWCSGVGNGSSCCLRLENCCGAYFWDTLLFEFWSVMVDRLTTMLEKTFSFCFFPVK